LNEISAKMSEYNAAEAIRIKSSWKDILERVRNGIRKAEREKKTEGAKSLSLLQSLSKNNSADKNGEEMANGKEKENEEKEGNGEKERETERESGRGSGEVGTDDQTLNIDRRHWESFLMANDNAGVFKETDKAADTARHALSRTYGVVLSDACIGQTLCSPGTLSFKC
jgi:hypothetical protein